MGGRGRTVSALVVLLACMVGMVAASVPLYRYFCKVSGIVGQPQTAKGDSPNHSDKTIVVRFDGGVMRDIPWRFSPDQTSITVHLGETTLASFTAQNLSHGSVTGTAVFNVTPLKAAIYVNKIQCFCFSEQTLGPTETAQMPVSFFIDPAIATDPNTEEVRTITLSYTFFKARQQPHAAAGPPDSESPRATTKSREG